MQTNKNEEMTITITIYVRYWQMLLNLGILADPLGVFGLKSFCIEELKKISMRDENAKECKE